MPNCKCCGKPVTNGVVLHRECYELCVKVAPQGHFLASLRAPHATGAEGRETRPLRWRPMMNLR
jgi:hypothetical protein